MRVNAFLEESHARRSHETVPGGNRASRETARWTFARRVSFREKANQSKNTSTHFTESLIRAALEKLRSRREWSESGDREMDFSPKGERAGASESIEVRV